MVRKGHASQTTETESTPIVKSGPIAVTVSSRGRKSRRYPRLYRLAVTNRDYPEISVIVTEKAVKISTDEGMFTVYSWDADTADLVASYGESTTRNGD